MTIAKISHVSLEESSNIVEMIEESLKDGSNNKFAYERGTIDINSIDSNPEGSKTLVKGVGKIRGSLYQKDYEPLKIEFEVNRGNDPDNHITFNPLEIMWTVSEH